MNGRSLFSGIILVSAAIAAGAAAQDRSADNAVTQAGDAFGFRVGRESIGIYSSSNTRGFSPGLSTDHVKQTNIGLTYDGRWKNVGEVSVSIGRSDYRDDTRIPGIAPALTHAQPWIGDATAAVQITSGIVAYAGFARGLEQSGVAPATAANRNQPLPAILTSQRDAGLRWAITGDIKLIAGVFDLRRPYFNFGPANIYAQVGTTRSRGAELSVNGHLTKRLTVVAGDYVLDPRVEASTGGAVAIGKRPVDCAAITRRSISIGKRRSRE